MFCQINIVCFLWNPGHFLPLRKVTQWTHSQEDDSGVLLPSKCLEDDIFFIFLICFYWSSICQHVTPSVHSIKCPPQCPSPSFPNPLATSPSATLCLFLRVRSLSWFVFLSNFSPFSFPPFPYNPFHYFLYSSYEWNHMIVLLWLTYFTQHNTLQFHPHRSKWWVFVLSDGWVILPCICTTFFFIHS